jgi:hypothetical protein
MLAFCLGSETPGSGENYNAEVFPFILDTIGSPAFAVKRYRIWDESVRMHTLIPNPGIYHSNS